MDDDVTHAVLGALRDARIAFVALRGLDTLARSNSDIDLLVPDRQHNSRAQTLILEVLAAHHEVAVVCRHVDVPVVWAGDGTGPESIREWDVCPGITWAFLDLLNAERVVREMRDDDGVPRPRPGDTSAILGVPALLGSRFGRQQLEKRLPEVIRSIGEDPDGALRAWSEALGSRRRASKAIDRCLRSATGNAPGPARLHRAGSLVRRFAGHPATSSARAADVLVLRARRATCGLWSARGARLQPLRKLDLPRDEWRPRLQQIKVAH